MGDPKRLRKKYTTPSHPFEKDRIEEENKLVADYGLKNKTEVWKMRSRVRKFRTIARMLEPMKGAERQKGEKELLGKLRKMGLATEASTLDDVLSLDVRNVLDRRLETIVFRKGLARSMPQARQLIVHGKIGIGGKKVSVPGYMVLVEEEARIGYYGKPVDIKPKEDANVVAYERQPDTKPQVVARVPPTKPQVATKPAVPHKEVGK